MSLRINILALAILGGTLPLFGQTPMGVEQPATAQQPTGAPIAGNPTFGEMIFEEPADWMPMEPISSYWITGEYWFGWQKKTTLPALVTTATAGTGIDTAGILGALTTQNVLGPGSRINDDVQPGFRIQGGYWLDREYGVRLEASVSYLASQTSNFNYNSTDFPILARPYDEVVGTASTPEAILIAHPDAADGSTGSLSISAKAGAYYDANINFAEQLFQFENAQIDGLFGYRFGRLADRIRFRQQIIPNAIPGSMIDSMDDFSALNIFHGLDFGFRGEIERGDFGLTLLAKLAAGNLQRKVRIYGVQRSTVGGATTTSPGGVFALLPNSGTRDDSEFTVFPEYGATLHWRARPNLRFHIGYRAMIFNDAIRAVDQIDPALNPDFFPPVADPASTPRRPRTPFHDDDIWIQSLTLGGEFTF